MCMVERREDVHGGKVGRCAWWKGEKMCMVERWEDVHGGKVDVHGGKVGRCECSVKHCSVYTVAAQ